MPNLKRLDVLFNFMDNAVYWKIIQISIILLSVIVSAVFYNILPHKIAIHWNTSGIPDKFVTKSVGLSIIPLIMLFIFLLFSIIPIIDPLRYNIQECRKYHECLIIVFLCFLFIIHLGVILINLGIIHDIILLVDISLAGLLYYLGIFLPKVKRNWFIGIRTPWSLSSERIWNKTHKRAGKLFKVIAVIMLLILVVHSSKASLYAGILLTIILLAYLILYSYYLYSKT